MTDTNVIPEAPASKSSLKRFAPLLVILIALGAFFALGGPKYFNIETLRDNREALSAFVEGNFLLAIGGFLLLYAVLVANGKV